MSGLSARKVVNPEDGAFVSAFATDGRELMQAWGLPENTWDSMTVKVSRQVQGSRRYSLIRSIPLSAYDLADFVREIGPGTYFVQAGPGPHFGKNMTITVDPDYAYECGFAEPPPQVNPIEQAAGRVYQRALGGGGVSREDLDLMIHTAVSKALQAAQSQQAPMDSFLKGFSIAQEWQGKLMDAARSTLGIPGGSGEPKETTMADVLLELGPKALDMLGSIATAFASAGGHRAPAVARVENVSSTPPARRELSSGAPVSDHPQNEFTLEAFPPEARPIVDLMARYSGVLRGHVMSATPASVIADQLAGMVGPALDPSVLALEAFVNANGTELLGRVDSAYHSDRAASIIREWAEIIRQNGQPSDPAGN